ncbi:MAG: M64 family metallopeptidase [Acidobacteriota bacterium]|nr:M64 family metallopeptidase [Acidobacteriota bacterium]MDQ7087160.1 M64 family metallopeptidase [Acidobacteriota bacterium]
MRRADPAHGLNITFPGDGDTDAEIDSYALDVRNTIDYLREREPCAEYRGSINFRRMNVVSHASGVDEPDNGFFRDPALDCPCCPSEPVFGGADCVPGPTRLSSSAIASGRRSTSRK